MRKFFNTIFDDKVLMWGFAVSFFLILLDIGITAFSYRSLPPFVPIYNAMSWGYGRIGTKIEIFIPIGITFLFFLINLLFSKFAYDKAVLLARCIAGVTGIISLISTVFIIQIILLVH